MPRRPLRHLIAFAAAGLLLSGCLKPIGLYWAMPEGPQEYQLGWQDGCDSGMSAQGSYLYRATYGFKKRPEMLENELYKQGWNEGFTYCRYAMASDQTN